MKRKLARAERLTAAAQAVLRVDPARSEWRSLHHLDPLLVEAVVLAEDRYFWRHRGIDWSAVRGAAKKNLDQRLIRSGASAILMLPEDGHFMGHLGFDWGAVRAAARKELAERTIKWGASTIPMQVARLLHGWSKRTYRRKLREALLALWLVARYERETVLEAYVNLVPVLPGTRGLAAGSFRLLGIDPRALSVFDATLLAAAVSVCPEATPEAIARSAGWLRFTQLRVTGQLVEAGHLDAHEAAVASAQIEARWGPKIPSSGGPSPVVQRGSSQPAGDLSKGVDRRNEEVPGR